MTRITAVDRNDADESVRRNFDLIQKKLGVVPNMMRTMAQSPRVLEGYLGLSGALSHGLLPATLQEQIALAIAEANACDYCLSAHRDRLSTGDCEAARLGLQVERCTNQKS